MNVQAIIRRSIDYIEHHLEEPIDPEQVASYAGFSMYHFHRLFSKEVGTSVADYIRTRRLCHAAQLLLYSEEPIIEIALQYGFESQEAFTRAFKKMYGLPPGQYRKTIASVGHQHKGGNIMEQTANANVQGWFLTGSHPQHYEIGVDRQIVHQGRASGYLKSIAANGNGEFGTMMQQFKADQYAGKRMKFSGFVKTEGVSGFCGLWMRVDNKAQDALEFDNMNRRPIKGDTNWNHYSVVLDVPDNSAAISFGVLLTGQGHVWVDGFQFEEVDRSVPTTNQDDYDDLPDEPANLSFEAEIE
ncbi:helix-turn-helix transcriptional regulator [Paenibacillus sp. MSJ-34]|uniref:helix-turn-helix transcriptional regulator n=1 Tax=Paenibacillus sp. MSJ-34 TaxID=2841529 RepID=UPI001C107416|nr:AraC family transcriptional regulator [Paenibacillus sp. MSJ-34]MBU5442197.1 AraC family transcriptional regulator [Paenibacillus sp. MSJ-34]